MSSAGSIRVRVVAFATAGDIIGRQPLDVELGSPARLEALQQVLEERFPALVPLWPRLAVAVNGSLVGDRASIIEDGAEVALLPPVSGGSGSQGLVW